MPFELCNTAASVECLMEKVLVGLSLTICLIYLDDDLVPGCTFDDHIRNLWLMLLHIWEAKLKLSPKKCTLFQCEVTFLGQVVSEAGVSTDPEKLQGVHTWPRSSNLSEVRIFLDYALIIAYLYQTLLSSFYTLLHRTLADLQLELWAGIVIQCPQESSNQNINHLLPGSRSSLCLDTDTSAHGIGAVLSHKSKTDRRELWHTTIVYLTDHRETIGLPDKSCWL